MTWGIEALDREAARRYEPALIALLQDSVDGGASVGFLPPLTLTEAKAYWRTVADAVGAGTRVLLVARDGTDVVGTAQLDLATRPNARHRAEVMKVMVHRTARRGGIGRALMLTLEVEARRLGRTTLVLDTRQGDHSERLYLSVGWRFAGVIPRYARSAGGQLDPSAFYYRLLDDGGEPT
jgi:GNAT superfamily N-acetyltransferase